MKIRPEQWVEALRSGNYEQGEGRLNMSDRMCCLGVLCDLSGEGHWYDLDEADDGDGSEGDDGVEYVYGNARSAEGVPSELANKLGLFTGMGGFKDEHNVWLIDGKLVPTDAGDLYRSGNHTIDDGDIKTFSSLAEANDDGEISFATIADFIESYPHLVFSDVSA